MDRFEYQYPIVGDASFQCDQLQSMQLQPDEGKIQITKQVMDQEMAHCKQASGK
jgi:hypothetical protein